MILILILGLQFSNIHEVCHKDYTWDTNKTAFVLRRAVQVGLIIKITYRCKTTYRFAKHFRSSSSTPASENNVGLTSSLQINESVFSTSSMQKDDIVGLTSSLQNDGYYTVIHKEVDEVEGFNDVNKLAFEKFKKDVDTELQYLQVKIKKLDEGHDFLCDYFNSPRNGNRVADIINMHASEILTIEIPNKRDADRSINQQPVYEVSSMGIHGDCVNIETKFNEEGTGTSITMKVGNEVNNSCLNSETITDVSEATTMELSYTVCPATNGTMLQHQHEGSGESDVTSPDTYTLSGSDGNAAPNIEYTLPNKEDTLAYEEGALPNLVNHLPIIRNENERKTNNRYTAGEEKEKQEGEDKVVDDDEDNIPAREKILAFKERLQEEIRRIKVHIDQINSKQVEMFHVVHHSAGELAEEIIADARTLHSIRKKRGSLPNMGNTFPNMESHSPNMERHSPNMDSHSQNMERLSPNKEYLAEMLNENKQNSQNYSSPSEKDTFLPNKGILSPNMDKCSKSNGGGAKGRVRFSLDTSCEEDSLQSEKERTTLKGSGKERTTLKANGVTRGNKEGEDVPTPYPYPFLHENSSMTHLGNKEECLAACENAITAELIESNEKYLSATMGADLMWLIDNTMRDNDADIMAMKNDDIMTLKNDDDVNSRLLKSIMTMKNDNINSITLKNDDIMTLKNRENLMMTTSMKDVLVKEQQHTGGADNDTTMDSGIENIKIDDNQNNKDGMQQLLWEGVLQLGEGFERSKPTPPGTIHTVLFQVLRNRANSLQTLLYEKQSTIDFLSRYVDKHELTNENEVIT